MEDDMALSQEAIAKASQKAQDYLEAGIVSLAISLGEDPTAISADMDIPVGDGDSRYAAYLSLIAMADALRKIEQ